MQQEILVAKSESAEPIARNLFDPAHLAARAFDVPVPGLFAPFHGFRFPFYGGRSFFETYPGWV